MPSLQKMSTKLFIQMSGAPGSGKSTVARLLRPHIDGVVIDHDVIRSNLLKSDLIPFDQAAKQAYSMQWTFAQELMKQGLSVIVDSTCNFDEVITQGSTLAREHSYTYWYVECKVSDVELLDRRLRSREDPMASQRTAVDCPPAAAQASRAGEDAHAQFVTWIENPCRPSDHAIIVNATEDPMILRDQILEQIVV